MDVVTLDSQVSRYDVGKLFNGIFLIKIKNEKGAAFTVKKFIKE